MTTPNTVPSANNKSSAQQWTIIRRPDYGRYFVNLLLMIFVFVAIWAGVTNPNFQWDVVAQYLLNVSVLKGLSTTISLTIIAMLLGTVVGIIIAMLMMSHDRFLKSFAACYIWLFRGTPLLVQLFFWFNISALYPVINIGIPGGPYLFSFAGNDITPFMAAVLGLALHEAAYMAEIVRGGVLAVGPGQEQAAIALGMTRMQAFARIVLPQALRIIIPATGNQVILMLKTTSLVSVIALPELLYSVQNIYARTFEVIPLLIVASLWYLFMCSLLSVAQYFLERYLGRGH